MRTPLHVVHTQRKVFVLPEVPDPYNKPHCAFSINQCHGLWANEDASGESDDNDEACLVNFSPCCQEQLWFSWAYNVVSNNKCAGNTHAVHSCPL